MKELKALEILKEIRNIETEYDHIKEHRLDEAIEELEEIVKEDIKNAHLFKKVCQDYESKLEELNNRSCLSCIFAYRDKNKEKQKAYRDSIKEKRREYDAMRYHLRRGK